MKKSIATLSLATVFASLAANAAAAQPSKNYDSLSKTEATQFQDCVTQKIEEFKKAHPSVPVKVHTREEIERMSPEQMKNVANENIANMLRKIERYERRQTISESICADRQHIDPLTVPFISRYAPN